MKIVQKYCNSLRNKIEVEKVSLLLILPYHLKMTRNVKEVPFSRLLNFSSSSLRATKLKYIFKRNSDKKYSK